jgi:hypothetical protein
MVFLDIKRISGNLAWRMAVTDMPCCFQKAQRIPGLHFYQGLWCGFDQDERAIFKLNGVAVVQDGSLLEIKQKFGAFFALKDNPATPPPFVVQAHGIGNFFRPNGRFSGD